MANELFPPVEVDTRSGEVTITIRHQLIARDILAATKLTSSLWKPLFDGYWAAWPEESQT